MEKLASKLAGIKTVAIAGHVRPDGDCIGSCMGLYLYLKENEPDIKCDVYLDNCISGRSHRLISWIAISGEARSPMGIPITTHFLKEKFFTTRL